MKTKLEAEHVFDLSIECSERVTVGITDHGYERVIWISGGKFFGDRLSGKVLPGGADWNTRIGGQLPDQPERVHVFAKYLLQAEDGTLISIENEGFKSFQNPGRIVTTPRFSVQKGSHDWLNHGVFVGTLKGRPDSSGVEISVYKML